MDSADDSYVEWIAGVKAGRPESAARIWVEFYNRLVSYADRRLGGLPRRSSDEEDVALSAMHSLVVGLRDGRFPDVSSRDDLLKIVLVIADRKAKKEIRKQMAAKRGGGGLRGDSVMTGMDGVGGGFGDVADRAARMTFDDVLSQECEELLDCLDDDVQRKIAVLKLQGYSNAEIAQTFGVVRRTIERKVALIRKNLRSRI